MTRSLAASIAEHSEGVCVSARYFVRHCDYYAKVLTRLSELADEAELLVIRDATDAMARELSMDGSLVQQMVDSFSRRQDGARLEAVAVAEVDRALASHTRPRSGARPGNPGDRFELDVN